MRSLIIILFLVIFSACEESSEKQLRSICNGYYTTYNVKPSRTIMEETGMVVAPCFVLAVNSDGTVDLECFPGKGVCKRICPDQIPWQTVDPYTKQTVDHTTLVPMDTIWWPYYEKYFKWAE